VAVTGDRVAGLWRVTAIAELFGDRDRIGVGAFI
jgi:hypothetical protein